MTVSFPGWPPSEWHNESFENSWEEYPIHGFTITDGDQNPRNDNSWKLLKLYYPYLYDIEITEIGSPQESRSIPAQTFAVEATMSNVGQYEMCCIPIDIMIGAPVILDTLLTEYDWPGTTNPYSMYGTYYETYYPGWDDGWRDQHDYIAYYYGWMRSNSNYAGGDAYEAYIPYYYCYANYVFSSPAFDTSEYDTLELQFLSYINHYTGQGTYTLEAGYSYDGVNWYAAWSESPGSTQNYEVSVPIVGGSPTTYIGFWLKGNPYNINYWSIDNVQVVAADFIEEYYDFACQGPDLIPGESAVFTFNDWTPNFLAEETTAFEVPYVAQSTITVEGDKDPGNNIKVNKFKLDYWWDPALQKVSSPSNGGRGDLLWDNGEPDGRNGLGGSFYYNYDNQLIDDFTNEEDWFVTDGHFSFIWNSGAGTGNLEKARIRFYQDQGDCDPSKDEYADTYATSITETLTGDYYFSRPEIAVDVEFDEVALPPGNWWVSFQPDSKGEDLAYMLTAEDKGCAVMGDCPYWGYPRWSTSQYMYGQDYDLAFKITGFSKGHLE